ncbi:hypothetical protein C4565_06155 [Candidatus Parcubacteria bacterium]|nr:MAG: hypothetical protein C4565_06155 [Candidatus Parcubacteria bacterium]
MGKDTKKTIDEAGLGWDGRTTLHVAISILVLLLAIYSFTYSGTFVTDDEHILASRTLSLAFDERINDTRVYGNSRIYSLSNLSPVYAAQAINIEPGQAVIGSVLARLAALLDLGRVQTIFLLNIWVTALTAVVIFSAVIILGHSTYTAFLSALLFGLGTMAWPYTRTYFRDPLAALFLTIAWACTQIIALAFNNPHKSKHIIWLAWLGLIFGLIAGILMKNTVTIAIPVLLAYLLVSKYKSAKLYQNPIRTSFRSWKKSALLIGVALFLLIVWIVFLPPEELFARFTPGYYKFLIQFFFTTPHPQFLEALLGPLVSPGKSIFIYSPVLLLSILGLFYYREKGWPAWLYLFLLIIGQALFYDGNWWGHVNWGLRFLLPALPPLVISSAPVIEHWLETRKRRIGLWCLGIISMLIQLVGILPPMQLYYRDVFQFDLASVDSTAIWNPRYSALLWHLKWLLSSGTLDLAAIRVGTSAFPVVLGWIVVIGLTFWGLVRFSRIWFPVINLLFSLGLTAAMLAIYSSDSSYFHSRNDLASAQEHISRHISPQDLVLIKSYGSPAWFYWMNWADPTLDWIALPFFFPTPGSITEYNLNHNPETILDEATLSLLEKLPGSYQRVWIVLPDDSPGADLDIEVEWLKNISISSDHWSFRGDAIDTRLYLFELIPVNTQ